MLRNMLLPKRTAAFVFNAVWAKKKHLLVLVVVGVAGNLLSLFSPIGMQILIDGTLATGSPKIEQLILLLAAIAILGLALSAYSTDLAARAVTGVSIELYARLFRHIVRSRSREIKARSLGEFVQRFSDLESAHAAIISPLVTAVVDIPFLAFALLISMHYSIGLTAILLFQSIAVGAVGIIFHPWIRRLLLAQIASKEDADSILLETVTKIDLIKQFSLEGKYERLWDDQISQTGSIGLRTSEISNLAVQLRTLISTSGYLLTIFIGAQIIMAGELTIGGFVAFTLISARIAGPARRLMDLGRAWQSLHTILTRLETLVDIPTERYSRPLGSDPERHLSGISVQALRISPEEGAPRLVSFEARIGSIVKISGPSGSGKTTLLRMLSGIESVDEGIIEANGLRAGLHPINEYRSQIACLIQPAGIFNRSLKENLILDNETYTEETLYAACQSFGLESLVRRLPEGIETRLTSQSCALSKGEEQLVCLARCLLSGKSILLLDEPLSGLDRGLQERALRAIERRKSSTAIVLVSHSHLFDEMVDVEIAL